MPKPKARLNSTDLQLIGQLFDDKIEDKVRAVIKEELGAYPTKDEFYTQMDRIVGELQTTRQEQTMLTQHDADQNDRLDRLENIHPNFQHS